MPKKAVFLFFLLAFVGAALFVYFTFPRTKDEIPKSNNQRPFPSAPGPNNMPPVPETVPHPDTPKAPPGPTLRVMAWASADEVKVLQTQVEAFEAANGQNVSLMIEGDQSTYGHDLQDALASDTPPDVCLISARDFSGLDPGRDLASVSADAEIAPRSVAAFTAEGAIKAVPDEFSVEMLFYNPAHFDRAGIGYPDRHWNWDIMESIARALEAVKLKDDSGQPIYPLELPADFDLWNVLSTQAGHPALDQNVWHLTDAASKDSQIRALGFIHEMFQELSVTAPLPKGKETLGRFFAQQHASLLIAPSNFAASLGNFHYGMTLLPEDITRASLAQVNGWGVTTKSAQPEAAQALAAFLAREPIHAGWSSVRKPIGGDAQNSLCYEALWQALVPRIEPRSVPLVQFLDQQIDFLARNSQQKVDALYAHIQTEYEHGSSPVPVESDLSQPATIKTNSKADVGGLRGL